MPRYRCCLRLICPKDRSIFVPTTRRHGPVQDVTMEATLPEITSMAQNADLATRKDIFEQLRNIALTLETPGDTVQRLLYLVLKQSLKRRSIALAFH